MTKKKLIDLGEHLASRDRARHLRNEVVQLIEAGQQRVPIDLAGIKSISDSFADEFFAILAEGYGDHWFTEHLDIQGASDVVRGSIVRAIASRLNKTSSSALKGYELAEPPVGL